MDNEFPTEETALEQSAIESVPTQDEGQDISAEQDGAIPAQSEQAQQEEEHFLKGSTLDPRQLPAEIQPIWKKMQGAYTKRMQEFAPIREQAAIVERFYSDRDFAFQTVAQWAAQNGYSIAPLGAQHPQAQQERQRQGNAPPKVLEAIRANLPEELKWMAEAQAPALMAAAQELLQPLMQHQQSQQKAGLEQEWDRLAEELTESAPGWEEHEPEMAQLLDFMQGPQMRHPKYGSKHQLLYNLVNSNAAATAQVAKRMNAAVKNRPASGITTGRTTTNFADRIKQAKTSQDAFRLAAQAAEGTSRG